MRLLDADPGDSFCLYGIAMEHVGRGAPEEAVRWFDRLLEIDPGHAYGYFHKARTLASLGRVEEAIAALRTGGAVSRGDAKAAGEIAALLDSLGGSPA